MSDSRLSREEIAKRDIGNTNISPRLAIVFTMLFLLIIYIYPLYQMGYEVLEKKKQTPQALDLILDFKVTPFRTEPTLWGKLIGFNKELDQHIKQYETELGNQSLLREEFLSPIQGVLLSKLKTGNEKVVVGSDGWLFYLSDIDYPISAGFMTQEFQKFRFKAAEVQPDPVQAIVDFQEQLKSRGIELIVMPVPVKPVIYPDKLSAQLNDASMPLQNESFAQWKNVLSNKGVHVFDPAPVLMDMKNKGIQTYLKTDTHWTPQAMDQVAVKLSEYIDSQVRLNPHLKISPTRSHVSLTGLGDIALMLNLENPNGYLEQETVYMNQVRLGKNIIKSSPLSEVLFLGDSFANIYSLEPMGWGRGSGLFENLTYHLKFPVDTILRNDAGSYATRELLAQELARGHDRLKGKKVVVWEFASRELVSGNWKMITLPANNTAMPVILAKTMAMSTSGIIFSKDTKQGFIEGGFIVPDEEKTYNVTGKVKSISVVPQPGSVPYKDHVMSIHLVNITGAGIKIENAQAMVYLLSMRNQKLTPAASLRPGQSVHIKLYNWNSMEGNYGGFNRSELDDSDISLQDPCWGELMK